MSDFVRAVAGDVSADALGVVDSHDHLFFATPRLPGQELDDARGDTTTAAACSVNEGPDMPGLLGRTAARIRRHLGDHLAEAMLVANPARAWSVAG